MSIADQIRASATHTFSLHWSNTLDARYTISYEVTASQSSPRPADGQTAVAAPTGTTGHICVLPRVRQAADQVRQKLEAALSGGLRQAQQKQRLLEEIAAISGPAGDYAGYDRWFRAVVPPRSSSFAAFSTLSLLQGELTLARAQVANLLFPVGQAAATLKGLLENQCLADLANDDRLMTWARQSVYGTVRRINRKTDAQDETPQLEM